MSVGNRIYLQRNLPSKELIEAFRKIPAAVIGDCMGRNCALHCSIHLMSNPSRNMCGPALTIQSRGGDNLFFHKALEMSQEGDVIVMATSFCDTNSVVGENIACNATFRKLGGLVFDALIRDIAGISRMELPIYATGTTPGGPHKSAPGEINVPISCGNCYVKPGDIIVGDADGVVVVPLEDAEAVLEAARKYHLVDMHSQEEAKTGTWNREWIDAALKAANVEIIDGCCR